MIRSVKFWRKFAGLAIEVGAFTAGYSIGLRYKHEQWGMFIGGMVGFALAYPITAPAYLTSSE